MSFCSLTKGISSKICRLCVCVVINKHSFELFMFGACFRTLAASSHSCVRFLFLVSLGGFFGGGGGGGGGVCLFRFCLFL